MTRLKVLFLTHRLPYAPNRGDRTRAYHLIRALRDRFSVHLVSLVHDGDEASHVDTLRAMTDGVEIARVPFAVNYVAGACRLATAVPLTHVLLDSRGMGTAIRRALGEGPPDVVLAYGSGMARFAFEPPLAGLPLVIDMVDVDSAKWKSFSLKARAPMSWIYRREAICLSRFERTAADRAFATIVVTEREREALVALAPNARVELVPVGVDIDGLLPPSPPTTEPHVIFCGVMNYSPNEEAAIWLSRQVWPIVRARYPDARLTLLGSSPTRRVRALAANDSSVHVSGAVVDTRPYLWSAAVATAPLQIAHGTQTKVLEAVAAGLPSVVTPCVAEGLPPEVLAACRVAASPAAFAEEILALLARSPAERRQIAERAELDAFSWDRCLAPLADLLQAAAVS